MKWEATILEGSPRAADWERVFGSSTVPIKNPLPVSADLPGLGIVEVYLLDVAALAPEIRARLIEHLTSRFSLHREDVERDLDALGVPLLAEHVAAPIRYFT